MIPDRLFPRLHSSLAGEIHAAIANITDIETLRSVSDLGHNMQTVGQTGGMPVTKAHLARVQKNIEEIATKHGFPGTKGNGFSGFDTECAIYLSDDDCPQGGEALRDEVWSFFGCVLLPHIVRWRFPKFPVERISGGVRNTFQRLWLRARAFDRGSKAQDRWGVLRALREDTHVSIIERPGLSASSRLALAIGEGWIRASRKYPRGMLEDINRDAVRFLRTLYPVISPEALDDRELTELVDSLYEKAAQKSGCETALT